MGGSTAAPLHSLIIIAMPARDFVKEMGLDEDGEEDEEEFCSRSGLQVTWPDAQLLHYNIAHVKAYSSDTAISRLWTASVVGIAKEEEPLPK